jgi:hypothetical protein
VIRHNVSRRVAIVDDVPALVGKMSAIAAGTPCHESMFVNLRGPQLSWPPGGRLRDKLTSCSAALGL